MCAIGILPLTMKLKDLADFVDKEWALFKAEFESQNQLPGGLDLIQHLPTWTQIWYGNDFYQLNF